MQRFKNILYINEPYGAKVALRRALELCRNNQARLTVASVSEDFPPHLPKLESAYYKTREQSVKDELKKLQADDEDIQFTRLIGVPFIEIIKYVQAQAIDLVVKPVEGKGGLVDMLFGSDDFHLMRKCPCPVWLIKPSRRKTYDRVLAAVDPDPSESANAELNALILDLATSLALQESAELHLVHAWTLAHENMLRNRVRVPQKEVDGMVREKRRLHKNRLDELLAERDFQGLTPKVHLLKGQPEDVIPQQARKKRVDLIVMGTVSRTGIPGFFIGNTSERILSRVDCSVLTVKPRAFKTPVK